MKRTNLKEKNDKFKKGTGCYKCQSCGKMTREVSGDAAFRGLCKECDEIGDLEVRLCDGDITQVEFDKLVITDKDGIKKLRKIDEVKTNKYEVGKTYTNKYGTPVTFLETKKTGEIVLQINDSGKKITVVADYELTEQTQETSQEQAVTPKSPTNEFIKYKSKTVRELMSDKTLLDMDKTCNAVTEKKADKPEKKVKLSNIIDQYLLQNKFTVKQIAESIKDTPQAQGKNVESNIHARIVSYKRKGCTVTKTDAGIYNIEIGKAGE